MKIKFSVKYKELGPVFIESDIKMWISNVAAVICAASDILCLYFQAEISWTGAAVHCREMAANTCCLY